MYLAYHRDHIFGKKYVKISDPLKDLFTEVSALHG